ncbi:MAG: hypothetical protein Q8O10_06850, partial [candidate division Zixibacteria bacterium]|nr:hypothetical protein [candidate division Zixibacteria bacterium]
AIACANCHTDHADFLSSQHYLIGKIKGSHAEQLNGIQIGKDYDKAKCGKCHLTCATCHFKGTRIQQSPGEVTDFWSVLLTGGSVPDADGMTNWSIDWTTNVESHDFAVAEDLQGSNDLCRLCHTGYYTKFGIRGYTDSDTLVSDLVTSQGVEKYPQYEEWRFLKGDINVDVMTVFPSLDSLYKRVENQDHYQFKCLECHDGIHPLTPINCLKCHNDKQIPRKKPHEDVACVACHDATMNPWRDPNSGDTVRVAAVKDNKVLNWRSHMIINPERIPNFCDRKCHNPETGPRIGAPWTYHHTGEIH